jgi:hypothetical protein
VVDCVDELGAEHGDFLAEIGVFRVGRELAYGWLRGRGARVGDGVHAIALGLGLRGPGELRH